DRPRDAAALRYRRDPVWLRVSDARRLPVPSVRRGHGAAAGAERATRGPRGSGCTGGQRAIPPRVLAGRAARRDRRRRDQPPWQCPRGVLELGGLVRLLRARRVRVFDVHPLGRPRRGRADHRYRRLRRLGQVGWDIVRRPEGVGRDRAPVHRTERDDAPGGHRRRADSRDGRRADRKRHGRDTDGISRRIPSVRAESLVAPSDIIATTPSLEALICAANGGDEAAWGAIVDRFAGLVWATARAHRLPPADAADVAQTTWLRLVENLDRIKD